MTKILFIGDIVGRRGREAVREVLPRLRDKYSPDAVIANVENLAHGKGVTVSTMSELLDLKIDAYTSGNHVFDKGTLGTAAFEKFSNLIRPANYPDTCPGYGYYRFAVGDQQVLVLNLNGTVFFDRLFPGELKNPFFDLDRLLEAEAQRGDIILLDFHAEATSEKVAMGCYADGKVSAVFGTHTHVPTADARVQAGGTAYITDVGMCGAVNSIIGAKPEASLNLFLEKGGFKYDIVESGPAVVRAMLLTCEGPKAISVELIQEFVK